MDNLAIFSLYKVYLLSLLCLETSKCIKSEMPKIFFLNMLVCCKQQDVERWKQNVQGGFPVQKAGQSVSLFGTPYGLNGLNIAKVSHV